MISLELYMVHVVDWPLKAVNNFIPNTDAAIVVAFVLCTFFAFIIHWFSQRINSLLLMKSCTNNKIK